MSRGMSRGGEGGVKGGPRVERQHVHVEDFSRFFQADMIKGWKGVGDVNVDLLGYNSRNITHAP